MSDNPVEAQKAMSSDAIILHAAFAQTLQPVVPLREKPAGEPVLEAVHLKKDFRALSCGLGRHRPCMQSKIHRWLCIQARQLRSLVKAAAAKQRLRVCWHVCTNQPAVHSL